MLRSVRKISTSSRIVRHAAAGSIVGLAMSLAGCSADIGRFGGSGLGYNGESQTSPTASLPTPSAPMQRAETPVNDPQQAYVPPLRSRSSEPGVKVAGLPDPAPARNYAPPPSAPLRSTPPARTTSPPPLQNREPAPAVTAKPGDTIDVQPGDTLYGISKKYRVSISELMTLNNLQNPALKPGQKLTLPAGKRPVAARGTPTPEPAPAPALTPALTPPAAPAAPSRSATAPAAPSASAPSDWTGTYTMAKGDSLYAIARRHNVKTAELQAANGITDPTKIRPGAVLKVPATRGAETPAPATTADAPAMPVPPPRPTIINGEVPAVERPVPERKVASLSSDTGVQTDATPAAPEAPQAAAPAEPAKTAGTGRFRWPVKGKVISGFGARNDGTHNDGINISVPAGTDVHAAENGVVAYAGNELKGYGNLVLIRHENNWVSAYAYNDQILVKRGDKVKRGQPIAKAGNTGSADQPQVHFELRQGSKPVDPMPHLEAN